MKAAENKRIRNENKMERIAKISDSIDLATFPIEKAGKTAIYNTMRNRSSQDFVNASAFNAMSADKASFALGKTLAALLGHLRVENGSLTSAVDDDLAYADVTPEGSSFEADASIADAYADLLAFLRSRLRTFARQVGEQKELGGDDIAHRLLALLPLIEDDSPHLELALELANELILLYAIKSAEHQEAALADGYGSESDEEDPKPSPTRRLRTKKLITHNGMRAILASILSSKKFLEALRSANKKSGSKKTVSQKITVFLGDAYYEVADALKLTNSLVEVVKTPNADVLVNDINACVTGAKVPKAKQQLTSGKYTVWVIDTTSATQAQAASVVEAFRASSDTKLLYLVSSGIKMEQFGADRNQYGTIRAFTDVDAKGGGQIDAILSAVKETEKPLGAVAHIYRRVMKSLGAVPRNRNLLGDIAIAKGNDQGTEPSDDAMDVDRTGSSRGHGGSSSRNDIEEDSDSDTSEFEESESERRRRIGAERLAEFRSILSEDKVPPETERAPSSSKVDKAHPSQFIHVVPDQQRTHGAPRSWFDVITNDGGGDCALYALEGKDLDFDQVVGLRDELAENLPDSGGGRISGSQVYQTLHDSGMNPRRLMAGRHNVSIDVMRSLVRVPAVYSGDLELQAYCRVKKIDVYVVTVGGEVRKITAQGTSTIMTVAGDGEASVKNLVLRLLERDRIFLYQSPNHFERITGVKTTAPAK